MAETTLPRREREPSMFDIYDQHVNRKDFAWLCATFGNMQYLDAGTAKKFRLVRVDVTEGPAVLKVRIIDKQGAPYLDQPVAEYHNGVEQDKNAEDLRADPTLKTCHYTHALVQRTDHGGFTGFGLGPGSYIKELEVGGPHTVWVLSPSLPSDGLAGIGMLGGTNHIGPLFLTFQITEGEEDGNGDDDEDDSDDDFYDDVFDSIDATLKDIHALLGRLVTHLGVSA